eukprot:scaffold117178_cov32-Prasinocladus_malaysianus.AAC.3
MDISCPETRISARCLTSRRMRTQSLPLRPLHPSAAAAECTASLPSGAGKFTPAPKACNEEEEEAGGLAN